MTAAFTDRPSTAPERILSRCEAEGQTDRFRAKTAVIFMTGLLHCPTPRKPLKQLEAAILKGRA